MDAKEANKGAEDPAKQHQAAADSTRSSPVQAFQVMPVPQVVAKNLLVKRHYLKSLPGGTLLAFGVFLDNRLLGCLTLGVGPMNAYFLVEGANRDDCLTLTRVWLSGELPRNSESRLLGMVLRELRRHTSIKFLVTYADPAWGHVGTIYQATNWLYTGGSKPSPRYDFGDGKKSHGRTVSHVFGTRSMKYFVEQGLAVTKVEQVPKHRYLFFLDRNWRKRLKVPVLPYPKKETPEESD